MFLQGNVSAGLAFIGGMGTFFTPCILPLIPSWLTLVSGLSFNQLQEKTKENAASSFKFSLFIFWPTLFFVLGFSLVFIILGSMATVVADILYNYQEYFKYLAGAVLLFLGLYLLGLFSPKFLLKERRVNINKRPAGFAGAFIVGIAFAAGWTPCVGPVLLGILSLAGMQSTVWQGIFLLAIFSLGLAIPFLVFSLIWGQALRGVAKLLPYSLWVNRILGVLLVILAVLLISGYLRFNYSW